MASPYVITRRTSRRQHDHKTQENKDAVPQRERSRQLMNKPSPGSRQMRLLQTLHMTTRSAATRSASNSTAASSRNAGSRRNSLSDAAGPPDSDGRPIKRRRLDSSSTPALRQSRSITPVPNDSNQDAAIPDVVPSLEGPSIGDIKDDFSGNDDDDESLDEGRQDEDESDAPGFLSPLPKRQQRRPKTKRAFTPNESIADSLLPGSQLQDEIDDLGSDQDAQKAARKLPGRRRAPNADPHLEACLRRQLQLRMGHRAVSKALKPLLLELASRTAEQLEKQEQEEQFQEIERNISMELQQYLEKRLVILESELRIGREYYADKLQNDQEYVQTQFRDLVMSLQDDYVVRGENRALELGRQYEHELDEDATDDEMGTAIRPLHGKTSSANPTGALDPRHDSRSRFFLETDLLTERRELRLHVSKQQTAALQDNNDRALEDADSAIAIDLDDLPESFGTRNEARRTEAIHALNVHRLASAAAEIEEEESRRRQQPVISNEDAHGLQALAAALEHDLQVQKSAIPPKPSQKMGYQPMDIGSLVKTEDTRPDLLTSSYPTAPVPNERNVYQQPYNTNLGAEQPSKHASQTSPISGTSMFGGFGHSNGTHMRNASDPAANYLPGPYTSNKSRRGLSISSTSPTGVGQKFGGFPEVKSSPRSQLERDPQLSSIPEARPSTRDYHASPGSSKERISRPFWQSVLSDSKEHRSPEGSSSEPSHRRRSETLGSLNGAPAHERKHSSPTAPLGETNPARTRSPPHGLMSPPILRSPWQQSSTSLPPQQPLQPTGPPPLPPMYYAVPQYAVPYVIYGPPPGPPSHPPPPGAAQAPPGVFFGPPPPPQFGPPTGPQQHYPWYRQ